MSISEYVGDGLTSGDPPRLPRSGRAASVLGAVLLLCSGCLGGPGPQPDATDRSVTTATATPTAAAPPTKRGGESLGAALAAYLDAEDRSTYADEHGLRTRNGRVEVVVELEAGTDLPATVDPVVVASRGNLIQARVFPDDLAGLAAHANVTAVRAPNRPATDAKIGGSE